jgi:hypothetical protein
MVIYQEKIAPPDPLPVPTGEPAEMLSSHRTTVSHEQENARLRERLARKFRKNK